MLSGKRNPTLPQMPLHCRKCLLQILDNVVNIFRSDGQTDRVRFDSLLQKLLRRKLGMRRGCRMNHKGFYIRHIGKQRKQLQMVDEILCRLLVPFDFKSKNRTSAVREILLIKLLLYRIVRYGRTATPLLPYREGESHEFS